MGIRIPRFDASPYQESRRLAEEAHREKVGQFGRAGDVMAESAYGAGAGLAQALDKGMSGWERGTEMARRGRAEERQQRAEDRQTRAEKRAEEEFAQQQKIREKQIAQMERKEQFLGGEAEGLAGAQPGESREEYEWRTAMQTPAMQQKAMQTQQQIAQQQLEVGRRQLKAQETQGRINEATNALAIAMRSGNQAQAQAIINQSAADLTPGQMATVINTAQVNEQERWAMQQYAKSLNPQYGEAIELESEIRKNAGYFAELQTLATQYEDQKKWYAIGDVGEGQAAENTAEQIAVTLDKMGEPALAQEVRQEWSVGDPTTRSDRIKDAMTRAMGRIEKGLVVRKDALGYLADSPSMQAAYNQMKQVQLTPLEGPRKGEFNILTGGVPQAQGAQGTNQMQLQVPGMGQVPMQMQPGVQQPQQPPMGAPGGQMIYTGTVPGGQPPPQNPRMFFQGVMRPKNVPAQGTAIRRQ